MIVQVFNGVLDTDDVAVTVLVAIADHGCQRSRLTGSRRAHEYDQAALGHRQFLDDRRQAQFINGWNVGIDTAHNKPAFAALDKGTGAKTAQVLVTQCIVALVVLEEGIFLILSHGGQHQLPRLLLRNRVICYWKNLAVNLDTGRRPRRNKPIGGPILHNPLQQ